MAGKGKLENLRPPWKPGESGNRSGRPRRSPISDRYEAMAEVRLSKEARDTLKLPPEVKRRIKTYGDLVVWSQFRSGMKGKTEAAREIADRIEGRAGHRVEMAGPDGREVVFHLVYDGRQRTEVNRWKPRSRTTPKGTRNCTDRRDRRLTHNAVPGSTFDARCDAAGWRGPMTPK